KEAAIRAMDELFGPIVGITLVLMSVFLPAAFIPGLTGKMIAQFAMVIVATSFLSAVNAATLKPTQCALWLRAPVPRNERNLFFRAFNAVYDPFERAYARLIGAMVARSGLMCVIALIVIAIAGYGLSRVASGFLPIEDKGYVLVTAQLPDGASLVRTKRVLDQVGQIAGKNPAVANVIGISGVSALDNNSTLANAGFAYVVLKDWSERGKVEDLRSLVDQFNKFGRVFQVYVQADSQFRLRSQDIEQLPVRNKQGAIIPLGTMVHITPAVGPSLLSLYNFYPSSTVMGLPATGFSSGEAMVLMEQIAQKSSPPGVGYEWTAMPFQEKLV